MTTYHQAGFSQDLPGPLADLLFKTATQVLLNNYYIRRHSAADDCYKVVAITQEEFGKIKIVMDHVGGGDGHRYWTNSLNWFLSMYDYIDKGEVLIRNL